MTRLSRSHGMKRYLTGLAALALGFALAEGLAGAPPAATAGVKVVPWKPVRGKLLRVDAAHKLILVQAPGGPHRISLAYGAQAIFHGRRQALSDLNVLRRFVGQTVVVGPEPNGMVLIAIVQEPRGY